MSFTRKQIRVTLQLGTGAFGESGENTVTLSGHRIHATIENAGGASMGTASLRIYGLTPSLMNQLSGVIKNVDGQLAMRRNQVLIEAGDDVTGMSLIFQGQTSGSVPDYSDPPDSALVVTAHAGLFQAVSPAPALSYPGSADAAVIMQNLAVQSDLSFENNGVSVMLSSPYFHGSPRTQMQSCAKAAGINWSIDNNTLIIWPKGGARGGAIPLVSPATGMIGYPAGDLNGGVNVRTVFNPQIQIGKAVQVQSSIAIFSGQFVTFNIAHELQSETPEGQWATSFYGSPFGGITT
jgi:hypothetical protein